MRLRKVHLKPHSATGFETFWRRLPTAANQRVGTGLQIKVGVCPGGLNELD